jgi:hypothetical protein
MGDSVIITNDVHLDSDVFSSATEQEGEYIGQPDADSGNTGSLRPITSGTPADQVISGTTTSNGAVDGTTLIDSSLGIYGDDFLIGATLAITSGAAVGESKTVTDSAQSTGTITSTAFTAQIVSGVTYTMTIPHSTRSYMAELTGSGDTGAATFKWSHDGGITYFGRNDPDQTNWPMETEIDSGVLYPVGIDISYVSVVQAANKNIVSVYVRNSDGYLVSKTSIDNGATWGSETVILANANCELRTRVIKLRNNRLIGLMFYQAGSKDFFYSDDDGVTWSRFTVQNDIFGGYGTWKDIYEDSNGRLLGVSNGFGISVDGGFTWSDAVTTTGADGGGCITEDKNGDLVWAYYTDAESAGDIEIKCVRSINGGATWGSAIDVIDHSGNDFFYPSIVLDTNGDLYIAAEEDSGDTKVVYSKSVDNGVTWGTTTDLKSLGGVDLSLPSLTMVNGNEIWCPYVDITNNDGDYVRRGFWEAYSGNAAAVPVSGNKQELCCSVDLAWRGYSGISGDIWTFENGYQYAMENTIDQLGPSKPWRSENDNSAQTILLDAGANNRFNVTGAAFHGCNLRTLDFQMNASDSWGSPSVDEEISFDIAQGNAIAANDGNTFQTTLSQINTEFGGDEVTNGGFDSDVTSWSANFCTAASIAGGQSGNCAEVTRVSGAVQYISQNISGLTIGSHYRISAYVKTGSSGDGAFAIRVTPISPLTDIAKYQGTSTSTWTQYDIVFAATHTSHLIFLEKANSDAGTMLFDTATFQEILPYGLQDHELVGDYIRFMPGSTESGNTFKVKDNVSDLIILDNTSSVTIGADDQFFIYSNKSSKTFSGGSYRYINISIDAQQTAEDYYQIGSLIAGMATTLSKGWRNGYSKDNSYNIKIQRTIAGVPIAQKYNDKKFMFSLRWTASETTREEVVSIIDHLSGSNFALIPDDDDLSDCYLVKHIGSSIPQSHAVNDRFNIGPVRLEEII